jgi:hypothetical protein
MMMAGGVFFINNILVSYNIILRSGEESVAVFQKNWNGLSTQIGNVHFYWRGMSGNFTFWPILAL